VTVGLANHSVLRSRNGRKVPIADSGAPIRDQRGQTRGIVLVFRDVSREQQARRTEGHLAAIVKYSDDPIISKDLNGVIMAWNGGAERMFGYSEAEAVGRPITIIVPEERLHEEPKIQETIRVGGRVEHLDTVRIGKDGRRHPVLVTISPILDEDGTVIGASKFVRDISKLKADEEELRRARDELEQRVKERTSELSSANEKLMEADRYKSEFLAAMSHELRTPLNSIIGFSEIIKSGRAGPVTTKQAEYLGMAHGSAKHLLNLINDLLDLSRIEAGRDEVFIEPFKVEPIIQEAVNTVRNAAQNKGLALEFNSRGAGEIASDKKKVYQIILNLLNNAVKFTERGKVSIDSQTQDGELMVRVADTGIGMTQEQLDSLFQAFQRVEQPARRIYEGTGLGLYLCKKLVTLLGGEIWAESDLGKGSRFSFKIPTSKQPYG
jgi:PAS domain S-box-containing protein